MHRVTASNVTLMPFASTYRLAGITQIGNLEEGESVRTGLKSEVHIRCIHDSPLMSTSSPIPTSQNPRNCHPWKWKRKEKYMLAKSTLRHHTECTQCYFAVQGLCQQQHEMGNPVASPSNRAQDPPKKSVGLGDIPRQSALKPQGQELKMDWNLLLIALENPQTKIQPRNKVFGQQNRPLH